MLGKLAAKMASCWSPDAVGVTMTHARLASEIDGGDERRACQAALCLSRYSPAGACANARVRRSVSRSITGVVRLLSKLVNEVKN